MMPCELFAPIRSLTIFKTKICMNHAHHNFAKLCMIILWLYFFIRSSRPILLPVGSFRSDMTIQETKNGLSFASRFCLCYYTLNTIFASISCLEFPNGDAPETKERIGPRVATKTLCITNIYKHHCYWTAALRDPMCFACGRRICTQVLCARSSHQRNIVERVHVARD